MFNLSSIAQEAHRVARIYAPSAGYPKALSWGFKQAWRTAKGILAIKLRDATMTLSERSRCDEAIAIQCSTDGRLSAADYSRLTGLSRAA